MSSTAGIAKDHTRYDSLVKPSDPPFLCQSHRIGQQMQTLFQHGVELINQGSYYHAHDVLEEVWREVRGDDRLFYQGVVQVAIAMHHFSKANLAGAQSVLAKA